MQAGPAVFSKRFDFLEISPPASFSFPHKSFIPCLGKQWRGTLRHQIRRERHSRGVCDPSCMEALWKKPQTTASTCRAPRQGSQERAVWELFSALTLVLYMASPWLAPERPGCWEGRSLYYATWTWMLFMYLFSVWTAARGRRSEDNFPGSVFVFHPVFLIPSATIVCTPGLPAQGFPGYSVSASHRPPSYSSSCAGALFLKRFFFLILVFATHRYWIEPLTHADQVLNHQVTFSSRNNQGTWGLYM